MERSAADLRRSSRSPSLMTSFGDVEGLAVVEDVLKVDLRVGFGSVDIFTIAEEAPKAALVNSTGRGTERVADEVVAALLRRAAGTAWISTCVLTDTEVDVFGGESIMLDAEVEVECPSDLDTDEPPDIDVVVPYPEFTDATICHVGSSNFGFNGTR